MKNLLFTFIALVGLVITLGGCSKDKKKNGFDYPIETLYGTWRVTHVEQKDGTMFDVTTPIAEKVFKPTYATFNADGTYSGRGAFGTGNGTYKDKERLLLVMLTGKNF